MSKAVTLFIMDLPILAWLLMEWCNETNAFLEMHLPSLGFSIPHAVLIVLEVQQPVAQSVTSISVEGNSISIPAEVFANPSSEAGQR